MPLIVRWRSGDTPPVEGEILRADTLTALDAAAAARLLVPVGNGAAELGELASVTGDGADGALIVEGDLRRLARIGQGQAAGRLTVRGDAGPHLGSGLVGGTIDAFGHAGAWAGAGMRGGVLHVRGSAGDHAGAMLPGARLGMREGVLLIEGSAAADVGLGMRRGLIAVGGALGAGAGRAMIAGTLCGFGPVGPGAGVGMKRGTILLCDATGGPRPDVLPTFFPSGHDRPPVLMLVLRALQSHGFPVPGAALAGRFARFNGDQAAGGQGELFVHQGG